MKTRLGACYFYLLLQGNVWAQAHDAPSPPLGQASKVDLSYLSRAGYEYVEVGYFESLLRFGDARVEADPCTAALGDQLFKIVNFLKCEFTRGASSWKPSLKVVPPDLIVTGAISAFDTGGKGPVNQIGGPFVQNGKLLRTVDSRSKVFHRGGVALLADGSIEICQPSRFAKDMGSYRIITLEAIRKACSARGSKVIEFVGGGMLLALNGKKSGSGDSNSDPLLDLEKTQKFGPGFSKAGVNEYVYRSALHSVLASQGKRVFLVWPRSKEKEINGYASENENKSNHYKSAAQFQHDLLAAGFGSLLKLDGGHAFHLQKANGEILRAKNGQEPWHMLRIWKSR